MTLSERERRPIRVGRRACKVIWGRGPAALLVCSGLRKSSVGSDIHAALWRELIED